MLDIGNCTCTSHSFPNLVALVVFELCSHPVYIVRMKYVKHKSAPHSHNMCIRLNKYSNDRRIGRQAHQHTHSHERTKEKREHKHSVSMDKQQLNVQIFNGNGHKQKHCTKNKLSFCCERLSLYH